MKTDAMAYPLRARSRYWVASSDCKPPIRPCAAKAYIALNSKVIYVTYTHLSMTRTSLSAVSSKNCSAHGTWARTASCSSNIPPLGISRCSTLESSVIFTLDSFSFFLYCLVDVDIASVIPSNCSG